MYGSPNPAHRKSLWENIRDDDDNNNKAWLVAWDFNEIATADECFSTSPDRGARQRLRFTNEVCFSNLNDLKFSGPKFTWNNGREGLSNVKKGWIGR